MLQVVYENGIPSINICDQVANMDSRDSFHFSAAHTNNVIVQDMLRTSLDMLNCKLLCAAAMHIFDYLGE